MRTQTLVKNAIIQVDATPFKQWYQTHYGVELGNKGKEEAKVEDKKVSNGTWKHGRGEAHGERQATLLRCATGTVGAALG